MLHLGAGHHLPVRASRPETPTKIRYLARGPGRRNPRTDEPMDATARRALNVLRKLFNDAKRLGYYLHDNPCAGAGRELPDYEPEWWVPSLDGFCRLIAAVPQPWRALPFAALLTSMGPGELAALDWPHVYFDRLQGQECTRQDPCRIPSRYRHAGCWAVEDPGPPAVDRHVVAGA